MDLKSTQYIEKTGNVAKAFLFLFLLFLSSIYNLFKFASLENEEVEVFEADLQTTKVGEGMVEAKPMKRYISLIEENGAWHIEGFYKHLPDDDN